jgi:hypothetical protein
MQSGLASPTSRAATVIGVPQPRQTGSSPVSRGYNRKCWSRAAIVYLKPTEKAQGHVGATPRDLPASVRSSQDSVAVKLIVMDHPRSSLSKNFYWATRSSPSRSDRCARNRRKASSVMWTRKALVAIAARTLRH